MVSIKEQIDDRLWSSIKRNYIAENYTTAILDAIQFIGDIIREKSGLDSDGNNLIGSAFGGNSPKIKLNSFKTESDLNFQKGIESILRGIYSAYRNPRSHSKINDTENDASAIIIYLNHILKIIDKSKGRFSTDLFLKRVFDEDFVPSQKYADLLVSEIPNSKFFEIAIEIFREKQSGKVNHLRYVWQEILEKLQENERTELLKIASEELRYTESLSTVSKCIELFNLSWNEIDEDARIRAENKLIKAIPLAKKNMFGQINEYGIHSAILTTVLDKLLLKNELAESIYKALSSSIYDIQRFILQTFHVHIFELDEHLSFGSFEYAFKGELSDGNLLIYNFLTRLNPSLKTNYLDALQNFVQAPEDDGLPF